MEGHSRVERESKLIWLGAGRTTRVASNADVSYWFPKARIWVDPDADISHWVPQARIRTGSDADEFYSASSSKIRITSEAEVSHWESKTKITRELTDIRKSTLLMSVFSPPQFASGAFLRFWDFLVAFASAIVHLLLSWSEFSVTLRIDIGFLKKGTQTPNATSSTLINSNTQAIEAIMHLNIL